MAGQRPLRPQLPERPVDRLLSPIQSFLHIEAAGGILLLIATAAALVWANSAWGHTYEEFWHTYLKVGFGEGVFKISLGHFVNDALMAIFFFVVGLEIKREFLVGELASPRQAAIPIAAAIGGMAVPATVYAAFNWGEPTIRGWAIPTATDIAFAVGILAMLGSRAPISLKVFLTALAIVDDIGAVAIIAFFYTDQLHLYALIAAGGFVSLSIVANLSGVRQPLVYLILGILMWLFLLESGVHATIGGVVMAFTIPSKMRINGSEFSSFARDAIDKFDEAGGDRDNIMTNPQRQVITHGLEQACEYVQTPLNRLEHGLHPWVAFVIMPIFALANAGVSIESGPMEAIQSPIGMGVAVGLLLGKPVGVVLATFIAVKLGVGALPAGTTWRQIVGAGLLAGIGFTMSLFIANLAFTGDAETLQYAKVGILSGSLVAGILGFVLLRTGGAPPSASDE